MATGDSLGAGLGQTGEGPAERAPEPEIGAYAAISGENGGRPAPEAPPPAGSVGADKMRTFGPLPTTLDPPAHDRPIRYAPLASILVSPDRQRKESKNSPALQELKRGIVSKGLLHAPVCSLRYTEDGQPPVLVLLAGERRLLAMGELHQDGLQFTYDRVPVPLGQVPYTLVIDLTAEDLEEAELEENILRANLTWQEEMHAKLRIHEMRQAKNPTQTVIETAKEIAAHTGMSVERERHYIASAQIVAPHLSQPSVKAAKSLAKAQQIVLDQRAAQLARDLRVLSPKESPHAIIHGDCREVFKSLAQSSFDAIISDPPYGIDADKQSFDRKHAYADSREYALEIYRAIFRDGWKLLRPQGTLFLFCDIDLFVDLKNLALNYTYTPWRTPIIWHKGNEGSAPWGKNGFVRTYETILYAVKGQRPLALPGGPDVRLVRRDTKAARLHAAEKPPELLRWLLQTACHHDSRVLDPCCGSAPLIPAAKGLGISLTLIEQDKAHYDSALTRLAQSEEEEAPESLAVVPKVLDDLDDEIFGSKGQ